MQPENEFADGYYLWTPNEPTNEVGARPIEIYAGELYAMDTQTPRSKTWCQRNGTFVPLAVVTDQVQRAITALMVHAAGGHQPPYDAPVGDDNPTEFWTVSEWLAALPKAKEATGGTTNA